MHATRLSLFDYSTIEKFKWTKTGWEQERMT